MLQVGLVDDEKAFKVNDGDDDGDINNDFHFDVNVTTSMTMMTMTTDMTIVFAVMTSQATLSLLGLCLGLQCLEGTNTFVKQRIILSRYCASAT